MDETTRPVKNNGVVLKGGHIPQATFSKLDQLRQDGTWCDLKLILLDADQQNQMFVVHRVVVAAASEYFAAAVENGSEEIELPVDIKSGYLDLCIKYIYGRDIFIPHFHLGGMKKCADMLQIRDLVDKCTHEMDRVDLQTMTDYIIEESASNEFIVDENKTDVSDIMKEEDNMEQQNELTIKSEQDTKDFASVPTINTLVVNFSDCANYSQDTTALSTKSLDDQMDNSDADSDNKSEEFLDSPPVMQVNVSNLLSCSLCPLKFKSKNALDFHEKKHKEGTYLPPVFHCSVCKFSCSTNVEFSAHKRQHQTKPSKPEITEEFENVKHSLPSRKRIGKEDDSFEQSAMKRKRYKKYTSEEYEEGTISWASDSDERYSNDNASDIDKQVSGKISSQVMMRIKESQRVETNSSKSFPSLEKSTKTTLFVKGLKQQEPSVRKRCVEINQTTVSKKKIDDSEYYFDDIASELQIPQDVLPMLDVSRWPAYLTRGRFANRPRVAYRHLYDFTYKEFKCEICGEIINGRQRFDLHVKKEKQEYVYCSFCSKGFLTKSALKTHEMRHKQQKNFKCPYCKFRTYFKCGVRKHIDIEHREQSRVAGSNNEESSVDNSTEQKAGTFLCSRCPKRFRSQQTLALHETRIHEKEQWKAESTHRCEHCNYVAFSARELELHAMRHSGEKPYGCTVCKKKAFRRKKELVRHMKEAHGQAMKLASQKLLTEREVAESQDRTFREVSVEPPPPKDSRFDCPQCRYTTNTAANLKAHLVTHEDSRPFACPLCRVSFKRKNVMVRHAWHLHKVDLRNACYEYTETGQRRRRELNKELYFVNASSTDTPFRQITVQGGGASAIMMSSSANNFPYNATSAIYSEGTFEGVTVKDESFLFDASTNELDIREVVVDSGTIYVKSEGVNISSVEDGESESMPEHVTVAQYHHMETSSLNSGDALVDSGSFKTTTITVPITKTSGLLADTEIVIDPTMLKAMGLDILVHSEG